MLYIIQMIASETVDPPRVFTDQTSAQTAYIALIREHRETSFAQYCTNNETDPDSFATAKAFADTLCAEDILFCYWELDIDTNVADSKQLPLSSQNREPVLKAAAETQQWVWSAQTKLRTLSEKLTDMNQELTRLQTLLDVDREGAGSDEAPVTPELPKPPPAAMDEKYQTAEWQDFVQSLIRMFGGNWSEFPLLPRDDWRQAIYGNHTSLQYWEWTAITIDQLINRAKTNGYAVEEDSEQSGHFTYLTPTGKGSSTLYDLEDLAWCAAGLHASQGDGVEV